MKENILTQSAVLYSKDGFVSHYGVEIAERVEQDGAEFYRINQTLHKKSECTFVEEGMIANLILPSGTYAEWRYFFAV